VKELIEEWVAAQPAELVLEPAGGVVVGEPVDPFGGGGELDPVPGLASADRDAGGQVGLAVGWVGAAVSPAPAIG